MLFWRISTFRCPPITLEFNCQLSVPSSGLQTWEGQCLVRIFGPQLTAFPYSLPGLKMIRFLRYWVTGLVPPPGVFIFCSLIQRSCNQGLSSTCEGPAVSDTQRSLRLWAYIPVGGQAVNKKYNRKCVRWRSPLRRSYQECPSGVHFGTDWLEKAWLSRWGLSQDSTIRC